MYVHKHTYMMGAASLVFAAAPKSKKKIPSRGICVTIDSQHPSKEEDVFEVSFKEDATRIRQEEDFPVDACVTQSHPGSIPCSHVAFVGHPMIYSKELLGGPSFP